MIEAITYMYFSPYFAAGYLISGIAGFALCKSKDYKLLFLSYIFLSILNLLFFYGSGSIAESYQHAVYLISLCFSYVCVSWLSSLKTIRIYCLFIVSSHLVFAFIKYFLSAISYPAIADLIYNYSIVNIDFVFNSVVTLVDIAVVYFGVLFNADNNISSRPDF